MSEFGSPDRMTCWNMSWNMVYPSLHSYSNSRTAAYRDTFYQIIETTSKQGAHTSRSGHHPHGETPSSFGRWRRPGWLHPTQVTLWLSGHTHTHTNIRRMINGNNTPPYRYLRRAATPCLGACLRPFPPAAAPSAPASWGHITKSACKNLNT